MSNERKTNEEKGEFSIAIVQICLKSKESNYTNISN